MYLTYTTATFIVFVSSCKLTLLMKFQSGETSKKKNSLNYPHPDNYFSAFSKHRNMIQLFDTLIN